MPVPPSGAVTFLFTDLVGSTRLWEEYPGEMSSALAVHDRVVSTAISEHGGYVFSRAGDAFASAFSTASAALGAALEIQLAMRSISLAGHSLRVRIGLHSGEADERDGDYFGPALNRCARLMAAGHGGQILLSNATRQSVPHGFDLELRDLGEHRLKDISQPERVFQLCHPELNREFPPLLTLEAPRTNLPAPLTTFRGREDILSPLEERLTGGRLVTVTGPGGAGKTRLATEVGSRVAGRFGHGVWLVELSAVGDPQLVPEALAQAVGAPPSPDRPILDRLTDFLHDREMLILLDNCEHLLDAAASTVASLLERTRLLKVLATSRERLGLRGEQVIPLQGLAVPDSSAHSEDLPENPSVGLFIDRVRAIEPEFTPAPEDLSAIAEISRRLDGIPLAIELAAARVPTLTPFQIAERLDDRFRLLTKGYVGNVPHHRTLEAAVGWSYELLSPGHRKVLRVLAVFSGSFDLDAAEAVVGEAGFVVDVLDDLVRKSLVVADRGRFRLLETIRSYAGGQLRDSHEEEASRLRHASHYTTLAEDLVGDTFGLLSTEAAERLEREHDNLRAALRWAEEKEPLLLARITAALADFWFRRGHLVEGRAWLGKALQSDPPPPLAARIALGAAQLVWSQGEHGTARALTEQCLEMEPPDPLLRALAREQLGRIAYFERNLERTDELLSESLALFETMGLDRWIGDACQFLGHSARVRGDLEEAMELHERAAHAFQKAGDDSGLGYALGARAIDHWLAGEREIASRGLEASRAQLELAGDLRGVASGLLHLAAIAWSEGDAHTCATRLREAIQRLLELGSVRDLADAVLLAGHLLGESGREEEARPLLSAAGAAAASLRPILDLEAGPMQFDDPAPDLRNAARTALRLL